MKKSIKVLIIVASVCTGLFILAVLAGFLFIALGTDLIPWGGKKNEEDVQLVEYAVMASWFGSSKSLETGYITDFNGDGSDDFIVAEPFFVYSIEGGRNVTSHSDKTTYDLYVDQNAVYRVKHSETKKTSKNNEMVTAMDTYDLWDAATSTWTPTYVTQLTTTHHAQTQVFIKRSFTASVKGKNVNEATWNNQVATSNLHQPNMKLEELGSVTYTGDCYKTINKKIESHFKNAYQTVYSCYTDYDNDGKEEAIFLLPTIYKTWLANHASKTWFFSEPHDLSGECTGVIVVDYDGENTVVCTGVSSQSFAAGSSVSASALNGLLVLNNEKIPLNGKASGDFDTMKEYFNLQNVFLTSMTVADVCDLPGEEYVCLANKQYKDEVFLYVIAVRNGAYWVLTYYNVSDIAVYLTPYNGQTHLLDYAVVEGSGQTYYAYHLFRFDQYCCQQMKDYKTYRYYHNQPYANQLADFYNGFNQYSSNLTVIGDPYRVTGQQWASTDTVQYGTAPVDTTYSANGRMGYVSIKDAKSWLNLREGPGTKYDCIYLIPGNKKSIVKQAQGAPVTVLETVSTGDKKNPVWYRVQITYAGQTIEGYSSANYITLY